jgi:hypothetical protein
MVFTRVCIGGSYIVRIISSYVSIVLSYQLTRNSVILFRDSTRISPNQGNNIVMDNLDIGDTKPTKYSIGSSREGVKPERFKEQQEQRFVLAPPPDDQNVVDSSY